MERSYCSLESPMYRYQPNLPSPTAQGSAMLPSLGFRDLPEASMSYCDVNSAYRPGYGTAYLDGTVSALPDALWSSRRDSFLEFSQQRSHDSPTPSCPSQSSTDASTWSPPPGTPWVTRERRVCRTPESIRDDCYSHSLHLLRGLNPSMSGLSVSGPCVALNEVQGYPDAVPDSYSTEDDYAPDTVHECYSYQATTYEAEHHYAPTFGYECSHPSEIAVQQSATQMIPVHGQDEPSASPPPSEQKRQRRKSQQPSLMPSPTPNKVIKRPSPTRRNRTGSFLTTPPSVRRDSVTSQLSSAFPCPLAPYGCTSSFGTKNEWKRHVNTQHLRLDLWRCDQCPERDNGPNEFNRKDLFVQHLRRMHMKSSELPRQGLSPNKKPRCKAIKTEYADSELLDAEQRCHKSLRQAPMRSCCLFCSRRFEGAGSWEARMEHVGRHLEDNKKTGRDALAPEDWNVDEDVQRWLQAERLLVYVEGEWRIPDGRSSSAGR